MFQQQPKFIINQCRSKQQIQSPSINARYRIQNPQSSPYFSKKKKNHQNNDKQKLSQQTYTNKPIYLSQTQRKMYQHPLIQKIMQKSQAKTVKHNVNQISKRTQLYACPLKMPKQQISTKTGIYASSCSRKVGQIYQKLNDKKSLTQKVLDQTKKQSQDLSKKNSLSKRKYRPKSADQNLNKRISVSGLVSYNFNSINAKKSLGFNPGFDKQQILRDQLAYLKTKNGCMVSRGSNIAKRRSVKLVLKRQQLKKAAVSDFLTNTDDFLKILKSQFDKDQEIYGQKLEKLKCIEDYMHQQNTNYDDAEAIVNDIAQASKQLPKQKIIPTKYILDQDTQLRMKKKILQTKRVMLRHLYFVE